MNDRWDGWIIVLYCTSELSLEQLGLRALDRLPRDHALDGIRAFNTMRYAGDDIL
jgi:hypothetical protein